MLAVLPGVMFADLFFQWDGTVVEVPDGNTLVISVDGSQPSTNRTVTLDGMRAPSTNGPAGGAACERLAELVKNKQVRVEQMGGAGRIYGTWVVIKRSGQVVNLLMVQEGLASVGRIRGAPPKEIDRDPEAAAGKMAQAQAEAQRQGLGIWKKEEAKADTPQ